MRNRIIALLVLLSFSFFAQAQRENEASYIAKNQIQNLQSGVLLVRLYNKKNVISALEAKGMEKRAEAVKAKQIKVNKEIITSFKNFKFCEVYFFYSDNSSYILEKEYSKVELFNNSGIRKVIELKELKFFVADFGVLKNENSTNSNKDEGNTTGRTKVKKYKGGTTSTNKRCMFLRDSNLKQLNRPFPYTVWFHPTPIQKLSYEDVVERMENQLEEFFAKNK
ncbi:hypothetical protein N9544_00180 [Flavobacteriales bacterium]|nr:hypothetical protein [Flavobacteriales bacterium]